MMKKVQRKMRAVKKLAGHHESADGSLRYVQIFLKDYLFSFFICLLFFIILDGFSHTHTICFSLSLSLFTFYAPSYGPYLMISLLSHDYHSFYSL